MSHQQRRSAASTGGFRSVDRACPAECRGTAGWLNAPGRGL